MDLHVLIKENSTEEARGRVGGQKKGHVGHGRAGVPAPDEEIDLPKPTCPVSHAQLAHFQVRTRTVVHMVPARRVVKQYSVYRAWSRNAAVAEEVFGKGPHIGVLGVDRYAVYGSSWHGAIQYCLEHYRRNVGDHLEADPENAEYRKYIPRLVVARKVSNGSQSEKGLKTRETLMSIIDTLRLRYDNPVRKLSSALDALARNPKADISNLLWSDKQP